MKPVAEVSRVVVADDQPAFREAAREVIEETEGEFARRFGRA